MRIGQSRRMSFIEAIANVVIGYGVAVASQVLILGAYGVHLSLGTNLAIGLWFTIISIVRSYWIRRLFNWMHTR